MSRVDEGAARRQSRLSRHNILERVAQAVALVESLPSGAVATRNLSDHLARFVPADFWITLAVVLDRLPVPSEVRRLNRAFQLDGVEGVVRNLRSRAAVRGDRRPRIITDVDIVDVSGIAGGSAHGSEFARRLVVGWIAGGALPVLWTDDGRGMRLLTPLEADALGVPRAAAGSGEIVVPYRSRYVLAGGVTRPRSAERIIALGLYSENQSGSVGYGLAPLLDPPPIEDRHDGEDRFSWHLAAQRSLERLAVVGAPEREYRGWVQMLAAVGLTGPRIASFDVPSDGEDWSALARVVAAHLGLAVGTP